MTDRKDIVYTRTVSEMESETRTAIDHEQILRDRDPLYYGHIPIYSGNDYFPNLSDKIQTAEMVQEEQHGEFQYRRFTTNRPGFIISEITKVGVEEDVLGKYPRREIWVYGDETYASTIDHLKKH